MYRHLVVCSLALAAVAALPFQGDPGKAAILAEKRLHNGDGSIDVAYAQEDGILFKETTNSDGERRGSYEYVGDDGKTYTLEYVAGKGGFRIIKSGHIDATPVQPQGQEEPEYREPEEYKEPEYRQPETSRNREVATGNTFNIRYNLSQNTDNQQQSYQQEETTRRTTTTTRRTTTTTTTPWPVRKNYHTGEVNLERNDKGYVYSYRHTG